MVFTAPAKLNLYLKVIGKREDGYHEIETLFERISLADELSISIEGQGTIIECDDPSIPTDEDSLLARAVRSFAEAARRDIGVKVMLKKRIPVSAGLGGGSSDAAALLKGLNQLSGFPIGKKALSDIGGSLGADIPFFMEEVSFGIGKGRGDIITGMDIKQDIWHILVNPPFEVSTKEVYGKVPAFTLTKVGGVDKMVSVFSDKNDVQSLVENLHNDLQQIVLREFPQLKEVFNSLLDSGARGALLSGSGPTVFGIFDPERVSEAADKIRGLFPVEKGWQIYVARTY